MANKVLEIAQKLANGEITSKSPDVAKAQKAIASLYNSGEQGRVELANIIAIAIEDTYNTFDISPRIFKTKHFNYGDNPVFKTHKKGIKAYWAAPNSYIPRSENYDTEISMTFESLGVRPTCLIEHIKTGVVTSYADLIKDARDAIEIALLEKVYVVIAQTYNATSNQDNYKATNALDKATLDKAIRRVRKETGGNPTIIGDYDLMSKIEEFVGFEQTDAKYLELRNHGELGMYRACSMIYLPDILNPVTQKSIVPTNKLFIVGKDIGFAATYGNPSAMQRENMDDKTWECRIDKEVGYVVTKPKGIFVIEITE